jgi:uncharacterized membrane protein YkoI
MSAAPRRHVAAASIALLVGLALHGAASGAQESLARGGISEDAAVALVREQTEGKVVRVDRKVEGGALVYHIRVLSPDGRLREYRVDAATGTVR